MKKFTTSKKSKIKKIETFNIKFKYNSEIHIVRNVKLLHTSDPDYHVYKHNVINYKRSNKPIDSVPDDSLRKFEKLSGLFEKCIFNWVKSSKNRILYWEEFKYNNWKKMYSEIDFVLDEYKNKIIIGEVKTRKNSKVKNSNRSNLYQRYNLLKCIKGIDVECYYIKIYLDTENTEVKNISNTNLFDIKTNNYIQCDTNLLVKSIKFSAKEVFDYGVKENIITDENFLDSVYEEQKIKDESVL